MAELINLKLLTDFFNKIGHQRPFHDVRCSSANTLRADSKRTFRHFAFGPKAEVQVVGTPR